MRAREIGGLAMDGRERLGGRIESGRGALGMRVPEEIELRRHTTPGATGKAGR